MRVGIITIHNHNNYGAILQAYALNKIVRRLGHQCKTIDCNIDPGSNRLFRKARHPGERITNLYNLCRWRANKLHTRRFRDFIRQQIPLTEASYDSIERLYADPPKFDAYITGSDQVWRPHYLDQKIGAAFHLNFISPDQSRLISYAPSFGVSRIPEHHAKILGEYLRRYHFLSVRERRAQEIIFELSGRKAEQVVDPTLLLLAEDYEAIVQLPAFTSEYVLVYPMELGKNRAFFNLVNEVKRSTGLPIVCVLPLVFDFRWLMIADRVVLDAGPSEFLGLFKNASIVCTNSFHGTVFSMLYQKNFFGVPHSGTNSRQYSLLETAGLLDRQLEDVSGRAVRDMLKNSIQYSTVNRKLQASIDRSIQFLVDALGNR
ncbi:MAG: polysaccharide pyruvyl transferase family protein [Thermodesulfobacteriota bacterium]